MIYIVISIEGFIMKELIIEGQNDLLYTVWIGQNAQDNWDIISMADQNDMWFHVEGFPSSHVILRCANGTYDKRILNRCAVLCKEHSKQKDARNVIIIYTEIKNITKGDKPGAVITKKTKKIKISLNLSIKVPNR